MTASDANEPPRKPLLEWVLARHPDTPKKRAKQWILAGRVRVGGNIVRQPHQPLTDPGAALELLDRHATALDCGEGWQIHPRLAILYLDAAVAVVNKGPGLIAVPAPGQDICALSILEDFLAGRLRAQDRGVAGKSLPPAYQRLTPLPVHRLDQYTSGVFCMAMNPEARQRLIDQLKEHHMRREYWAYVQGRPTASAGTWRNWLQLSEDELRQRIVPGPGGKDSEAQEAVTHYEVVAEYPLAGGKGFVTKLRCRLETGRKHQIRAQAAHAGLPLVGDRTYHPAYRRQSPAGETPLIPFPRQALHAESLTFEHPDTPARVMTWKAFLPKDLRQLEAALRNRQL